MVVIVSRVWAGLGRGGWRVVQGRSRRLRLRFQFVAFGLSLLLCLGMAHISPQAWSQETSPKNAVPTEVAVPEATSLEQSTAEGQPVVQPILVQPVPGQTLPTGAGSTEAEGALPLLQLQFAPVEGDASAAAEADSEAEASEEETVRVPVVLNDRPVFSVAAAGGLTAKGRANSIRDRLDRVIEEVGTTGETPQLEIRDNNGSPTLVLNGDQLVTVTAADLPPGSSVEVLAETWTIELRQQLQLAIEEKQPDFWRQRGMTALMILCSALVADVLFRWLWGLLRLGMLQNLEVLGEKDPSVPPLSEKSRSLLNFGFRILATVLLTVLWLGALSYTADLFPATRRFSLTLRELVVSSMTAPLIPIGNGYSIVQLLMLAGLLLTLVIVAGALTDLLKSNFLNVLGVSRGVQEAIAIVFRYCFITLSAIVLLQLWGIDLSSLAILASALGVGIGFGFQDIAKNFGSGLVLVFERPIQVGDFVEVGGYSGTIEKLGARSTMIRTMDNLDVFVPNSRFLEEEVTNWSHARSPSRIKIPVGVAYGTDLGLVQEGLLEAALANKNVLKTPEPTVLFEGFGDSALDFVLMVWIVRPQQHARIKSELNFKIDAAFRRRDIEIPFPQRDLHVRSGLLPIQMEGGVGKVTAPEDGALDVEYKRPE